MAGPTSIDDAVDWLHKHFHSDSAAGVSAVYHFDLAGPDGGPLSVRVSDGRLEVAREPAATPDVRLALAAGDYFGILVGRENADLLYMAGRLEIDGDLSLAMKLHTLFRAEP